MDIFAVSIVNLLVNTGSWEVSEVAVFRGRERRKFFVSSMINDSIAKKPFMPFISFRNIETVQKYGLPLNSAFSFSDVVIVIVIMILELTTYETSVGMVVKGKTWFM